MTVSPFLTTGSAGAPMCIDMGMTTCSGTGILLVGCPAVAFACGTAAPLAERFRDLNNLISPVSLIFLAADGISAPPSVVDNYTDLLYHFSKACQATKYDKRSILHRTRKICNNLGNRRRIKGCIKINNPTKKKAPDGISLRGRYGRGRACPARACKANDPLREGRRPHNGTVRPRKLLRQPVGRPPYVLPVDCC